MFKIKRKSGSDIKIGKPYKIAYSEAKRISFKDGVSQKFPLFEEDSLNVYGLVQNSEHALPMLSIKSTTSQLGVYFINHIYTADAEKPHLIHGEQDVYWGDFTLPKDAYKEGIKAKMPKFLSERKELGKWDVTKNYIRYRKMLDRYAEGLTSCINSTYIFNLISFVNNDTSALNDFHAKYKEFINSIKITEDITCAQDNYPDNYEDFLKYILKNSSFDSKNDYMIQFRLESQYVRRRENGEIYAVDMNGNECDELTDFYKELMNNLEITWLRTNAHVVNKSNTKEKHMINSSVELTARYRFNAEIDKLIKSTISNEDLDMKVDKKIFERVSTAVFSKYFKFTTNAIKVTTEIVGDEYFEQIFTQIRKYFKIDVIETQCPMFKHLIEYMKNGLKDCKTLRDLKRLYENDTFRWVHYTAVNEVLEYIRNQTPELESWKNFAVFIMRHINWSEMRKLGETFKDIIIRSQINLIKKLIGNRVNTFKDDESSLKTVKDIWLSFPANIESIMFAKYGYKVINKIIIIIGNVFEKFVDISINNYAEVNPFCEKELSEDSKEFIEFTKEFMFDTIESLVSLVDEFKGKKEDRENKE